MLNVTHCPPRNTSTWSPPRENVPSITPSAHAGAAGHPARSARAGTSPGSSAQTYRPCANRYSLPPRLAAPHTPSRNDRGRPGQLWVIGTGALTWLDPNSHVTYSGPRKW